MFVAGMRGKGALYALVALTVLAMQAGCCSGPDKYFEVASAPYQDKRYSGEDIDNALRKLSESTSNWPKWLLERFDPTDRDRVLRTWRIVWCMKPNFDLKTDNLYIHEDPDPAAEAFVELMSRFLVVEPASDEDMEIRGIWSDVLSFFGLYTSIPKHLFPDLDVVSDQFGRTTWYNPILDDTYISAHRMEFVRIIRDWLEPRRGRIVFSSFYEDIGTGKVEVKSPLEGGGGVGFCALEEQTPCRYGGRLGKRKIHKAE